MPTPPPMPPPPSMPPPLPMPTAPSCPAPVQPFLPPLSGPLHITVLHLPNLGLVCTTISFNKLFSIVPLYGTAMAAYRLQPVAFALCTIAKPGAISRNRPWDPGLISLIPLEALIPRKPDILGTKHLTFDNNSGVQSEVNQQEVHIVRSKPKRNNNTPGYLKDFAEYAFESSFPAPESAVP
ncbi:hypothetical protein HKD37_03G006614 [Glycine soja]